MKKMYLAVFLIILIAVVFCGCLSFSNTLIPEVEKDETTTAAENRVTQSETVSETQADIEPESQSTAPSQNASDTEAETIDIDPPTSSEFDVLKSGTFYMKGGMTDSSGALSPMEIAMTPSSMFVLSDFNGASMGILIKDNSVYMIYEDEKAYLELSDSIMQMAGLDINELTSSGSIDFSSLGSLSEAQSVTQEEYNGRTCQVYHFENTESGEKRIYMDGTKLIRIAMYSTSGKFVSATEIDSISSSVPAGKSSPPSDYKAYKGITGMISFMTLIGDLAE